MIRVAKYRKKPIEVEAFKWTGDVICVPRWFADYVENSCSPFAKNNFGETVVLIETLEGVMTADPGDYIIKGVKGELYPCKPDIFKMTYERV